ncbi:MAG: peptide deformylase [Halothiobacillaceae bacterium]|nr:peptide deformylase [Halothiobacillaceae bacterium]
MAILDILHYPDERLRIVARPVSEVTLQIRQLAADMLETMYAAPGIGLAATQVNAHVRLFVTDCSEDKTDPRVFINPEILETSGVEEMEEGCLSIPGVQDRVARPERVRLRAMNLDGETFELDTDGLLAVCIQHETDHLNGKLFIDYLSPLKRQRIRKKLEKALKQRG